MGAGEGGRVHGYGLRLRRRHINPDVTPTSSRLTWAHVCASDVLFVFITSIRCKRTCVRLDRIPVTVRAFNSAATGGEVKCDSFACSLVSPPPSTLPSPI